MIEAGTRVRLPAYNGVGVIVRQLGDQRVPIYDNRGVLVDFGFEAHFRVRWAKINGESGLYGYFLLRDLEVI